MTEHLPNSVPTPVQPPINAIPGFIDHVPTQAELNRMYPFGMPNSFMGRVVAEESWGVDSAHDIHTLGALRDEIIFSAREPAQIRSLYEVADHIGNRELMYADSTGEVSRLLDASRWSAEPRFYEMLEVDDNGTVGTHNEAGVLRMDLATLNDISVTLLEAMEVEGTPLLDPKDAYLITFLHVAAHETGHSVLSGISKTAKSMDAPDVRLLASKLFLGKHPELGFTGKWDADARAHEERFTEGYAQMVIRGALMKLGYNEQHTTRIIELIQPPADFEGEKGQQGYELPLATEGLVAQLVEVSQLIKSRNFGDMQDGPEDWSNDVESRQSDEVRNELERLKTRPTGQRSEIVRQIEQPDQQLVKRKLRNLGRATIRSVIPQKRKAA